MLQSFPMGWAASVVVMVGIATGAHGAVPVACDVDASGRVDALDVQIVINGALGLSLEPGMRADLDYSQSLNAFDVQLVINAALGLSVDRDQDGLADAYEANLGTNPDLTDTDADGMGDGEEVVAGRDPLVNGSSGVTGTYDPQVGLVLQSEGLELEIPGGASPVTMTVVLRRTQLTDFQTPPPAGAGFVGASITSDGQISGEEAVLRLALSTPTILPALPVLTYHETTHVWMGTGEMAAVAANGQDVEAPIPHFSILGVPDNVPIPEPGDPVGSFVVLSNNGNLSTEGGVSSQEAALLYSEIGDTFSISATSQTVNDQGQIETKAMGFSSILVTKVENYVIGVVGGATSLYNDGQFNEPAVGVMVMSVKEGAVSMSIYAATPERTITGTMTGTAK